MNYSNKLQYLRRKAFRQQNCLCFYCHLPMWDGCATGYLKQYSISEDVVKYLQCTAEHLVARQDGGKDVPSNIKAACLWCNSMRHQSRPSTAPDHKSYAIEIAWRLNTGEWHPAARCLIKQSLVS